MRIWSIFRCHGGFCWGTQGGGGPCPEVLEVVKHKEEVEVVDKMKFFLGC